MKLKSLGGLLESHYAIILFKAGLALAVFTAFLAIAAKPINGLNDSLIDVMGGSNSFTQMTTEPLANFSESVYRDLSQITDSNETTQKTVQLTTEVIQSAQDREVKEGSFLESVLDFVYEVWFWVMDNAGEAISETVETVKSLLIDREGKDDENSK